MVLFPKAGEEGGGVAADNAWVKRGGGGIEEGMVSSRGCNCGVPS
jgi:hypothetical protein